MELDAATAHAYVLDAFRQMLDVAHRLGDDLVNERPHGPGTNSVAALVTHCCGVTEYWLGHVVLGRPSHRDRDAEFTTAATVAELRYRMAATMRVAGDDLAAIGAGTGPRGAGTGLHGARDELPGGTDASVVLHVLEELFQHLGHMELTADALLQR
jgi:hypothetical protein